MISLKNGLKIAYQEYGRTNPKKLFALHGWLDNSNSFNFLGPYLANLGYHVVALDHVGHGLSSHLPKNGAYQIPRYASAVRETLNHLGWEEMSIVGHSMGAAIGILFSSAFPKNVKSLVMMDNFGPLTFPSEQSPQILRKAIEFELELNGPVKRGKSKAYENGNAAVEARLRTVTTYPGLQYLSRHSAEELVRRGVYRASHPDVIDLENFTDGPVYFRHDPRLLHPSYSYFTPEQVHAYVSTITCPCLLITGENGWPPSSLQEMEDRKKILEDKGLLKHLVLPGSHHLHMDPDSREAVANSISHFLTQYH